MKKYYIEDYIGKQINYLTPIEEAKERGKNNSKQWIFRCVCGEEVIDSPNRVISGHKKSCGCLKREQMPKTRAFKKNFNKIKEQDYIGRRSHKLTVIGLYKPKGGGRIKLHCKCDCGGETFIYPYQFDNGDIKSCGCLRGGHNENEHYKRHGMSKENIYRAWQRIKSRCYNTGHSRYDCYGGRGIKVCQEWLDSPQVFIDWALNNGYDENLTIDRIDVNGDYSPENCRWVGNYEQARNKRSNVFLEYNGKEQCLTDWANELHMNNETLRGRLKRGWSIERALSTPVDETKNHRKKQNIFQPQD